MEKIYRFINTNVPSVGCNLRCEYCYIKQHGDEENVLKIDTDKKLFKYPVNHMIKALTIERMGGVCMFNISGSGETMLCPDIMKIVKGLLNNGHYVALISNCTVNTVVDELVKLPENERKRIFIKASFHYRALKQKGLLDVYANNIKRFKDVGIAFSVEIVSSDYVLDDLDELKQYSLEKFGALPHVLGGRDETTIGKYGALETELDDEEFYKIWSSFDSNLFEFQYSDFSKPLNNMFCYAGDYTGSLDLTSGEFYSCPGGPKLTNFFENIEEPVVFFPVGRSCPFPFCFCGFFLQVLAGVGRDEYEQKYTFDSFRDRQCSDGSTWLNSTIRELFSHRCSEWHKDLSDSQKEYITCLRKQILSPKDISREQVHLKTIIIDKLRASGISEVAIYGDGKLGDWLKNMLEGSCVNIKYIVDKKYTDTESIYCSSVENINDVDAIIVTPFADYTTIVPQIRKDKPSLRIIAIQNLMNI